MTNTVSKLPKSVEKLFDAVLSKLELCESFGSIVRQDDRVCAQAIGPETSAFYFLSYEDGSLWAGLATEDRWLSQSIEADLLNTGDSMVELIDEELADLDCALPIRAVEHFRDTKMRYTFRSRLPDDVSVVDATSMLCGYEAAFRELGDMMTDDED